MSLRKQLLAFGLLMLVLPWAGYRFVQEMETTLRGAFERALLASAGTVAAALDDHPLQLEAPWSAPRAAADFGAAHDSEHAADPAAGAEPRTAAGAEPRTAVPPPQTRLPGALSAGTQDPVEHFESAGPAANAIPRDRPASSAVVYAEPLAEQPGVDGVLDDGWSNADSSGTALEGGHRYWAGVYGRYLYLYVAAHDADVVHQGSPGDPPYGDRLVLALESGAGPPRWLLLASRATGTFRPQLTSAPRFEPDLQYEDRVLGAWRETADGFAIEARVPLGLAGDAVGIALIDVDAQPGGYAVTVSATWDWRAERPGPLIYQRPELERLVEQFGQAGSRFRVSDPDGWVLADTGSIAPAAGGDVAPGIGDALFRALLRRNDPAYEGLERRPGRLRGAPVDSALMGRPAAAWYRDGPGGSTVVAAAAPIRSRDRVLGAVLLEQASDPILTLTNRALVRLMTFTLLATSIAGAGLLGFATLLSFRVRRLARAAETALGPKGEIDVALPGRSAGDELGDLARSFGRLLERLREHTQYLKTLASKLSHELRTPLAVVSTSLDNLEQEATGPSARPYLERLRQGASRLDAILAAMSEATRMEQAIGDTQLERFDLAAVAESCCRAYSDIYSERRFRCSVGVSPAPVLGSAELTAQLIDKLVDNAVGFSPPGSLIEIALDEADSECRLSVRNRGPLLPDAMRRRLFDSMVSVREREDGQPHLGLGLHIVALIAEFHGGRAEADNLPDGSGVVFSVWYPRGPGA